VARYELLSEDHGRTIVVGRLIGQADGETVAKLGVALAAQAADGAPLRILLDEGELRAGLILPQDIRGIVDDWRSVLVRPNVRLAAFAPNPIIYGLNRLGLSIAARDTGDRVAVFSRREEAVLWLLRD
jgi:hypothetical protein